MVDSRPADSLSTDSTLLSQLKAPLDFESQDSIVILPKRNLLRMYGNGQVKYETQQLQGDFMQMQIDSGNIYSTYIDYPDSLNRERIYACLLYTSLLPHKVDLLLRGKGFGTYLVASCPIP